MSSVGDVIFFLGEGHEVHTLAEGAEAMPVRGLAALGEARPGDVTFVRTAHKRKAAALADSSPTLLIAGPDTPDLEAARRRGVACVVVTANPRLSFARTAERFFAPARPAPGVHPSAVVSERAVLGERVHVGARCVLGEVVVGDDCVLHPGVVLYDGTGLGKRVEIHANTVVGADGFGFERDAEGVPHQFPQHSGVVVGNDVQIGAATCVDRGSLADTVIEDRAKIDNLVHIAHNVRVGEDTLIAANAVIAGSTVLGKRVWVGPSACVSNGLVVGDDAMVSLGAVVTRDVEPGQRVTGNFAVEHARFLKKLRESR